VQGETLRIEGVDNLSRPGSERNRGLLRRLGIAVRHADLRMASDLEGLGDFDWVIDAAALPSVLAGIEGTTSSRQVVENNLFGTVNLLELCRSRGAGLILLSTSRVYSVQAMASIQVEERGEAFAFVSAAAQPAGCSARGIAEDFSTAAPVSLYGATKLASEQLALEYGAAFGLPVRVNRCGVLAGAGQFGRFDQGILAFWMHSWRRGRPLRYLGFGGGGRQVRDFLHPRDLVALLQAQMADPGRAVEPILNFGGGGGNACSLAELSAWCGRRFGPRSVASCPAPRTWDVPWIVMDSSRAEAIWGFRPETPLEAILDEIATQAENEPEWLELSEA